MCNTKREMLNCGNFVNLKAVDMRKDINETLA
jgi:hypothetical protein